MTRSAMLWALLLLPLLFCSAQSRSDFHTLAQADGLSQSFITKLSRSSDGFIWIGTQVGLDRFDGQHVRHFRSSNTDSTSIVGGYVWVIEEDSNGYLWIGTDRGLCRYDPRLEQFQRIQLSGNDQLDAIRTAVVHAIWWDSSGQLWVGTTDGFWPFNEERFDFQLDSRLKSQQEALGVKLVEVGYPLSNGGLLIGSTIGPLLYDAQDSSLVRCTIADELPLRWAQLLQDHKGRFIAGTQKGLIRFRLKGDSISQAQHYRPAAIDNGSGNHIGAIIADGQEHYYLATNDGLFHLKWGESVPEVLTHFQHDPNRETSLSSNQVQCLFRIDDNWLWAGTRHGIARRFIGHTAVADYSLAGRGDVFCSDDLKGMAPSPSGRYLVIGSNLGCSILDRQTGEVRCLNQDNFPALRNNYIINVEAGPSPDSYWLCFRRGGADLLLGVEAGDLSIKTGIYKAAGTSGTGVYQVAAGVDGRQWMATGKGLFLYDPITDQTQVIAPDPEQPSSLPHEYLFSLTFDQKGDLWVGGARAGLSRLDELESQTFTTWRHDPNDENSLSHDMILHLFADHKNRIWMSTPSGICVRFNDGRIRRFGVEDGLPSDLVFGILEDQQQQLWINTTGGILKARLSPDDDEQLEILDIFTTQDDLTGGRAQYGFNLLADGKFALTGGGINIFHPDSLFHRQLDIPIVFTELQLFNEAVTISDSSALTAALPHLKTLQLAPSQNFPGFNFAPIDLRPDPADEFSYRMLGMHDEWISTQNRSWVGFPQLQAGNYILEVRAGLADDPPGGLITRLPIYLKAPWYQRRWAYGLYALVIAGLVWLWSRQQRQNRLRIEAARIAEREAFRKRSARDFHDESGNYLTRLSLLTEVVRRQVNGDLQLNNLLNQLDHNVQDLREGMRDFIWALDPGNDQVYELSLRLKRFGQELFTHHPARFSMNGLHPDLQQYKLRTDQRRHLLLLFKEAMHNSLKHAPSATEVSLSIAVQDNQLIIKWADNGPGYSSISAERTGNGLKNMRARAEKVEGQLFFAQPELGSEVHLQIALQETAGV